jgi:hypothetical protein
MKAITAPRSASARINHTQGNELEELVVEGVLVVVVVDDVVVGVVVVVVGAVVVVVGVVVVVVGAIVVVVGGVAVVGATVVVGCAELGDAVTTSMAVGAPRIRTRARIADRRSIRCQSCPTMPDPEGPLGSVAVFSWFERH